MMFDLGELFIAFGAGMVAGMLLDRLGNSMKRRHEEK